MVGQGALEEQDHQNDYIPQNMIYYIGLQGKSNNDWLCAEEAESSGELFNYSVMMLGLPDISIWY